MYTNNTELKNVAQYWKNNIFTKYLGALESLSRPFFLKSDAAEFINLKKIRDELSSIKKKKVNSVLIKNMSGRKIVRLIRAKKNSDL